MLRQEIFITIILVHVLCLAITSSDAFKDTGCFEKWLQGYRLANGHPQRTLTSVTLERCKIECEREKGCAGLAYGVSGSANGSCELAIRTVRDSRSVTNTTVALPYDEITKSQQYDIYLMSAHCLPRAPLFSSQSASSGGLAVAGGGNGVPIDCFYRLMSGKRLAKNHVFRSISVGNLQECQEACIEDRNCRSISYRYMVSGYTYNVANCELSPFYIVNYEEPNRLSYDFIDDYDYDYFQREPHCKTTSRLGSFGVCAIIVQQGAKLAPNLIKSTHHTSTATQCEFLCQTASRFRCKAFSLRHTTRGRDPFHRDASSYESTCTLYDNDISRLSKYDIVLDPDYDLYELGRLMGADCVLYDQYLNKRPQPDSFKHTQYYPVQGRDRERPIVPYPGPVRPPAYPEDRFDYHSRRPGSYYRPEDKLIDGPLPPPSFGRPGLRPDLDGNNRGSSHSQGVGVVTTTGGYQYERPPPLRPPVYYDPAREACLVKIKQDIYLAPEATRAQFPVKSLEECRIECIRSVDVLRFSCRVMSFRLTSNSGGSCQLTEYHEQDLRSTDYIPARDRYEDAAVYAYDESDPLCRRDDATRYPSTSSRYGGGGGGLSVYDPASRVYPGSAISTNTRYGGSPISTGTRYGGSGYGSSTVIYDRDRSRPPYDYTGNRGNYPLERPIVDTPYRPAIDPPYRPGYDRYGTTNRYEPPRNYLPYEGQTQTVNGEKCLRACTQDREAGFYYCNVDNRGTWDFCCRPDHFCGYSRGLSVPWCYVGSGPTSQVWRSCNHRLLSSSLTSPTNPRIEYLHDRPPPKILSLEKSELSQLSKDNALKVLKSEFSSTTSTSSSSSSTPSDFENIDDDETSVTLLNNNNVELVNESSNIHNSTENFQDNPKNKANTIGKSNRRTAKELKNPSFTVVEVKSSRTSKTT